MFVFCQDRAEDNVEKESEVKLKESESEGKLEKESENEDKLEKESENEDKLEKESEDDKVDQKSKKGCSSK